MLRSSFSESPFSLGPKGHRYTQRVDWLAVYGFATAHSFEQSLGALVFVQDAVTITIAKGFVVQTIFDTGQPGPSWALAGEILQCLRACNPQHVVRDLVLNGLDPFWRPNLRLPQLSLSNSNQLFHSDCRPRSPKACEHVLAKSDAINFVDPFVVGMTVGRVAGRWLEPIRIWLAYSGSNQCIDPSIVNHIVCKSRSRLLVESNIGDCVSLVTRSRGPAR